ncbi:hypothetical protein OH492_10230 [Vibrio chagasii]|nr:hypothetical protein [Vibrio chagasii]
MSPSPFVIGMRSRFHKNPNTEFAWHAEDRVSQPFPLLFIATQYDTAQRHFLNDCW